jgi:L-lactate dehydrogenase complex protein LldG
LSDQNVPVYITETGDSGSPDSGAGESRKIRREITESFIGVTSADFCVAETATLVMKTRPNQARAVSLLPLIHVAVIRLEQVLADLRELYATLKWEPAQKEEGLTNCTTMISGPSKTADIELVMVHGAHGPRELYLYVITGP